MNISRKYYLLFAILTFIYLVATFSVPPDPVSLQRYNVTVSQLRLLLIPLVILITVIWSIAFYGFIRFKIYADLIKKQPDGKAMNKIANGLGIMAISFPFNSILDVILLYIGRLKPYLFPTMTIITNYSSLIFSLLSFTFILMGSKDLLKLVKTKKLTTQWIIRIAIVIVGFIFAYLTLQNPIRQFPGPEGHATYYLPDFLIITTIVIPTVYVWYAGFEAAFNIQRYQEQIPGILYKKALQFFAWGIIVVILSSVLIQILGTFSTWLVELNLNSILELLYVLLIIIAIGFILIAMGAKKLKKIEEI